MRWKELGADGRFVISTSAHFSSAAHHRISTLPDVSDEHLLIFARYPELGKVKTRLAAGLGEEAALSIYRQLLAHTRAAVAPLPAARTLWLAAAPPPAAGPLWPGTAQQLQPVGADLGQRMAHAFAAAFAQGARRVVVIGTDCPGLRTELLATAFEQLRHHDVVLGPAADGGYYLLGLGQPQPALFEGIRWSTDSVLRDTLAIAERQRLTVARLPTLQDVDTAEDWQRWQAAAQG
ncbi:TIGR04282 family arsenosugar biosynthesis glycosyltransferase [Hymenobacter sp. 15J16-1T3B]|uniref:TIGR04282 family arsenosugar biosynthesis glycosyltransferase n=1 Tax=Hymenobacter sp. 15J16-1T3B TaxID=2886941 RepID=UPI001D100355|nr:TIGR04282 family arsenosugar biosynthesis glycosyltransferase [Hymenobacter sp. 15J16-1T3B]MCC3156848.1 TIGR04282 family arsenosugar biosynthesis glycosyltransferase [Hymenobacter sp. 15J16-1T3B]